MLDEKFTEQIIIKASMEDSRFAAMTQSAIEERYFQTYYAGKIFGRIKTYFQQYKQLPTKDIILADFKEGERHDVSSYFDAVNSIDFKTAERFDFLVDSTDEWLKQRAMQLAIMDSAEILAEKKEDSDRIRSLIESALTKTLKIDLGLNYFEDLGERLKRIFSASEIRVPTFFPSFDEVITGGFPAFTLSVFPGRLHAGKSLIMVNFIIRQVLHGLNPVLFTLEMSQDAMAQRIDSILTNLDINKIYVNKKNELVDGLKKVSLQNKDKGTLFIKQFSPSTATVNDFRVYLHELEMRGFKPDIIYCDYINLMKPEYKLKNSNMYEEVKRISEELRGMSFEYKCPVVSVTQYNRAGMVIPLQDLDYNHISESLGIAATADFLGFLGMDEDMQVYQNEMHYKILKGRFGGLNHMGKFYVDNRSLKMYDELELQEWLEDVKFSEGCRDLIGN